MPRARSAGAGSLRRRLNAAGSWDGGPAEGGPMRLRSRINAWAGAAALALVAAVAPAGAAGAAAQPSEWPQFGQSARHLNTTPTEHAFPTGNVSGLQPLATASFGANNVPEGGPAVAGGIIYIAGFDGILSAFSTARCGGGSCKKLWQGRTGNDITSTPAVAGGLVLIGSADHI